jgi:hypothetical protein
VGKPAAAGWRAIMHRDGLFEFPVVEGDTIVAANVVSPLSGWAIGVGANEALFEAPLQRAVWEMALAAGVAALLGLFAAAIAARRLREETTSTTPLQTTNNVRAPASGNHD